jgi:hypothetical protein
MRFRLIVSLLLFAAARIAPAAGPKVYMSVNMEGIAGVVTGDQLSPQGAFRFFEFVMQYQPDLVPQRGLERPQSRFLSSRGAERRGIRSSNR